MALSWSWLVWDRYWHTSYLSFFLHGHNFLLNYSPRRSAWIATKYISRQSSVNHKKMILQQNSVKYNKTPYIIHNISPHYRFSSHFSCGEFFLHDNVENSSPWQLVMWTNFSTWQIFCPWQISGMHSTNNPTVSCLSLSKQPLYTTLSIQRLSIRTSTPLLSTPDIISKYQTKQVGSFFLPECMKLFA